MLALLLIAVSSPSAQQNPANRGWIWTESPAPAPAPANIATKPVFVEVDRSWGTNPCILGDIDGDGVREVLVIDRFVSDGTARAWTLSGRTGEVIRSIAWEQHKCMWFAAPFECGGDVDGDGFEDWACKSGWGREPRIVVVHSGRTGEQLLDAEAPAHSPRLGSDVTPAGDFDRDGIPDLLLTGAAFDLENPMAVSLRVMSGKDGSPLLDARDPDVTNGAWGDVDAIGDQDGDGWRDLVVVSWHATTRTMAAKILSGRDGSTIRRIEGLSDARDRISVTDAGDLNGDGVTDLLVACVDSTVRLHSGCDGKVLFEEKRPRPHVELGFGSSVAGFVDSSGAAFVLIGAAESNAWMGEVECWSVADHKLVFVSRPSVDDYVFHYGAAIRILGDADGDGTPDFTCSPDHGNGGGPGRLYVCSGKTGKPFWSAKRTSTGVAIGR